MFDLRFKMLRSERKRAGSRCAPHTSKILNLKSHIPSHIPPPSTSKILNLKSHIPHAFTLIELLITITIIATLSAVFVGASRSAMDHARAARTKTTIAKLHTLLMERWASYTTRRVPDITTSTAPGQVRAAERLNALRIQMMLDMPERWSEVGVTNIDGINLNLAQYRSFTGGLYKAYQRRKSASVTNEHQSAECLYMVILLATGDGEARTLFSQQDIGDTDEDGAPEFLDGWGRPIYFVRWPKGFTSSSALQTSDPLGDHDPFDPFRVDNATSRPHTPPEDRATRLVPLVVSAGPDGLFDLVTRSENTTPFTYTLPTFTYVVNGSTWTPRVLDPYLEFTLPIDSIERQMADELDTDNFGEGNNPNGEENWHDNIHNHLLDGR